MLDQGNMRKTFNFCFLPGRRGGVGAHTTWIELLTTRNGQGQSGGPLWVVSGLWMFSHKFEHPTSIPHYFSFPLVLSVAHADIYIYTYIYMCVFKYMYISICMCKSMQLRVYMYMYVLNKPGTLSLFLNKNKTNYSNNTHQHGFPIRHW